MKNCRRQILFIRVIPPVAAVPCTDIALIRAGTGLAPAQPAKALCQSATCGYRYRSCPAVRQG
ncbi:MAG: hypothetical protein LBR08_10875 [Bacteroidales bacterium]|nr:hypothetical protein [Bacteroidales bacterium]